MFQKPDYEEMMIFYFDKFNFDKKDLSPFVKKTSAVARDL